MRIFGSVALIEFVKQLTYKTLEIPFGHGYPLFYQIPFAKCGLCLKNKTVKNGLSV